MYPNNKFKFILPSSTSINLGVGLVVVQAKNRGSGRGSGSAGEKHWLVKLNDKES